MRRYSISIIFILSIVFLSGYYFFTDYWEHRFDVVITRQARVFNIDELLIWSVIYEETYFRRMALGADAEIGLMQVTPTVAKEWAKSTGLVEFERHANEEQQQRTDLRGRDRVECHAAF